MEKDGYASLDPSQNDFFEVIAQDDNSFPTPKLLYNRRSGEYCHPSCWVYRSMSQFTLRQAQGDRYRVVPN